jgi:hypothetical protein
MSSLCVESLGLNWLQYFLRDSLHVVVVRGGFRVKLACNTSLEILLMSSLCVEGLGFKWACNTSLEILLMSSLCIRGATSPTQKSEMSA